MADAMPESISVALAAATAAAEVMIAAAKTAAMLTASSSDHDALTRLQGQVEGLAAIITANNTTELAAIGELKMTILLQNGRLGKLETWKTQATAIYGAILLVSPPMFYMLLRIFGS